MPQLSEEDIKILAEFFELLHEIDRKTKDRQEE